MIRSIKSFQICLLIFYLVFLMIWLSTPHFEAKELEFLSSQLAEENYLHKAQHVSNFQSGLSRHVGKPSLCTNSGTSAIHIALKLLEVGYGDEVLCSDFSFAASAFPASYERAKITFIDCEADTWGMDPVALQQCLELRKKEGALPKAIIIVHSYGMPYKVDDLHGLAAQFGVPIIEDAAEALGSTYNGNACGSFGHLSAFSFNLNKIITSCGGGSLQCSTEDFLRAKKLINQAKEESPFYLHNETGYNYRINNIGAVLGCSQLQNLKRRIASRRRINERYRVELAALETLEVFTETGAEMASNHWLSCIRFNRAIDVIKLCKQFKEEHIEVRPLWKPLHTQQAFKGSEYFGIGNSELLFSQGLCLPSSSNLTDSEQAKVIETIKKLA